MPASPGTDWPDLWPDFLTLCGFGGRFCGTESETAAGQWLMARLHQIGGVAVASHSIDYPGWQQSSARLEIIEPAAAAEATALVLSPATPAGGLEAEVVDLGEGRAEDFAAAEDLTGCIALVRHSYAFASDHLHRNVKYGWACERGAAAFLIANTLADGLISGSAGSASADNIPAAGITGATAAMLTPRNGINIRARLHLTTARSPGQAANLIAEVPGRSNEWVVKSAHNDGHDLSQSAIDNASGVVVALSVARALAARAGDLHRGLRICLFSAEEWGLIGSQIYLEGLDPAERGAIALDVNLDAVAGAPGLTALTSGFERLEPWLDGLAGRLGEDLAMHRPLLRNSDHYNFAQAGIPALRLVAGFDDPRSNVRHILSPGDTVDKVTPQELERAATLVAEIVYAGCTEPDLELR